MRRLNLGCGGVKITDCDNADCNPLLSPDIVLDLKKKLPIENETYDCVYLFHTIEHIEKKHHFELLTEIRRVLKEDGTFLLSYPEFAKIASNWLNNYQGKKDFWEATIYGRQLYPSDYHIALMDSKEVMQNLLTVGFKNIVIKPEPQQDFNTIVKCTRGNSFVTYEEVLFDDVFGVK